MCIRDSASDGYREGPEGRLVEAHFHAGWIALAFLKDAKSAAPHFESMAVSYTHLRAHETVLDLVCRLLLEKKKK